MIIWAILTVIVFIILCFKWGKPESTKEWLFECPVTAAGLAFVPAYFLCLLIMITTPSRNCYVDLEGRVLLEPPHKIGELVRGSYVKISQKNGPIIVWPLNTFTSYKVHLRVID